MMDDLLSTSPRAVAENETAPIHFLRKHVGEKLRPERCNELNDDPTLSLNDMVEQLPYILAAQKKRNIEPGSPEDQIFQMMSLVEMSTMELERFALSDPDRNYTRNLISSDGETYTLLLLCWNPNKSSPIHDHPCDGCWMRILKGQMRESRYHDVVKGSNEKNVGHKTPSLEFTDDETFVEGQVAFINDSLGYHKLGNDSHSQISMTLHLYSPPFELCRSWSDPKDSSYRTKVGYYSANGIVL